MNTLAHAHPLTPQGAAAAQLKPAAPGTASTLRERVLQRLSREPGWEADMSNVHVEGDLVVLQGVVRTDATRANARRAAAAVPGVQRVWDARVRMREWQSLG
jgi:osmotically-inducible protein OsmY